MTEEQGADRANTQGMTNRLLEKYNDAFAEGDVRTCARILVRLKGHLRAFCKTYYDLERTASFTECWTAVGGDQVARAVRDPAAAVTEAVLEAVNELLVDVLNQAGMYHLLEGPDPHEVRMQKIETRVKALMEVAA